MTGTRFDAHVAIGDNESLPHVELHMVLPAGDYDSAWRFAQRVAGSLSGFGMPFVVSVTRRGLPGRSLPDQVSTGNYTWTRKNNSPEEELDQGARNLLRASQEPPCAAGFYGCPDRTAHVHTGPQETAGQARARLLSEGEFLHPPGAGPVVESLGLSAQAWLARRAASTGRSVEFVLRELIEAGIQKTEDQHQAAQEQLAAFPGRRKPGG